jgi:hypothetical protein
LVLLPPLARLEGRVSVVGGEATRDDANQERGASYSERDLARASRGAALKLELAQQHLDVVVLLSSCLSDLRQQPLDVFGGRVEREFVLNVHHTV